ncbi:hypothetical protein ACTD5D_34565 [Nocardia takedensis]|uniref:hypothetical protein n=1 Tax=Nocardia takedensis TaxID=259390 RepID=UPI000593FF5D|nr:hypothetical protein [Nocardia takedensis]
MSSNPSRPEWVRPRWWVHPPGADPAVSGKEFIAAWYRRMSEPKPPQHAVIPEITGWSVAFGERRWVIESYHPRPAELARAGGSRKPVDEPDQWNAVTRLYADYVDPFARFSGGYAEAVDALRPTDLPQEAVGWVRPLKNRVPKLVREAMAGTGGHLESRHAADTFVSEPAAYADRYGVVAGRAYLTVLLERLHKLRTTGGGDAAVLAALEATIARHTPHYGEPDPPRRAPTQEERDRVRALLEAQIEAEPWLRGSPYLGGAYERANTMLLNLVVDGRTELEHAGILLKAVKWQELDEKRREFARGEVELADNAPAAPGGGSDDPVLDARLTAARTVLRAHVEPDAAGPEGSWEKAFATRLLETGNLVALDVFGSLADLVAAAWQAAVAEHGGSRPPGALTADPLIAARYTQMLLAVAVSAAPPRHRNAAYHARRLRKVEDELAARREDDEESPS